jgi:hypothetical protein
MTRRRTHTPTRHPTPQPTPRSRTWLWTWLPLLLLTIAITGCTDRRAQPTDPAAPEPFQLTIALSTNSITLGDLLDVTVTAWHPPATQVRLPEPDAASTWTIRDSQTEHTPLSDTLSRTRTRYRVTSFRVGEHTWTTGAVRFIENGNLIESRPLPNATLTVRSVLTPEDAGPATNKPPLAWPDRVPRWIPVFLGIAALAALLALLIIFWVRRRSVTPPPPPPIPPHEKALAALHELETAGHIEAGRVEPFYLGVSAIVRRYLEDRFHLRAPESTTEEFIREAASARVLMPDHQQLVQAFLEQCDLVKFARFQPSALAMRDTLAAARRLIEETRPAPAPAAAPKPEAAS